MISGRFDDLICDGALSIDMAAAPGPNGRDDPSIISSVDGEGVGREYVIADITEDGAWLATEVGDALELDSWR